MEEDEEPTMDCTEFRNSIDDRLDSRLGADRAAECDRHAAECAACRDHWAAEQAAWGLVGRQAALEPSVGFAARTLRRLATEPRSRVPWWRAWPVWRWAALGATAAVLLVAGIARRQARTAADARAAHYAAVAGGDYLEDYDVIASLDQLNLDGGS
jgi:anti-sigma factor RsiW